MPSIVLEHISKRYGTVTALDDVSLTIEAGTFFSIFGPPGSGKTVLLRVLLGLESPDTGRILIDGRDVTRSVPRDRNLAMVFQNLALFPQLTARENIAFPLLRRKLDKGAVVERVDRVAAVLNITAILDKKPAALSGGERQRVAIARSLVRDARAYLMDEPIAALDARLRDAARVELKRLQGELGRTFVYVTHDHEEAMSVADRMAILDEGRIVQVGLPDAIYADPEHLSVAELVGAPRINVLRGTAQDGRFVGPCGAFPLPQGLKDVPAAIAIAIRPEAIRLSEAAQGAHTPVGRVTDVEPLGAFSIVTIAAGNGVLRVVTGRGGPTLGATVAAHIAAHDVLAFDPRDGVRLR